MITFNENICGFIAVSHFIHPKAKNIFKTHRLVILPEYQGFGIGKQATDEIAKYYISNGKRYRETTSHPARISSHKKNDNWKCVSFGRAPSNSKSGINIGGASSNRLTSSWEFKND